MPAMLQTTTLLLAAGAAAGAVGLALLAAALLAHGAEERDFGNRLNAVLRPAEQGAAPANGSALAPCC